MMLTFQIQLPAHLPEPAPLVVLLHGRGADESDMLGLAPYLPGCMIAAVRAPFPAAPWGYGSGFAWYRYLGGVRPDPQHLRQAVSSLDEVLAALPAALPAPPSSLILGGFSQGGTVSLAYALQHPGRVQVVLNLSGFLPDHPDVQVTPASVANTTFYWPHGLHDPAIPHTLAVQGRAALLAAGACVAAPDYAIGHAIVREELEDIAELVKAVS